MLFNNTWSQIGHLVSCLTILFYPCTSPDKAYGYTQSTVSLAIADGYLDLPRGFVWVCMA